MRIEFKTVRSIILRDVDPLLYNEADIDIKEENITQNSWCSLLEVFKFSKSHCIKIGFASSDSADHCL